MLPMKTSKNKQHRLSLQRYSQGNMLSELKPLHHNAAVLDAQNKEYSTAKGTKPTTRVTPSGAPHDVTSQQGALQLQASLWSMTSLSTVEEAAQQSLLDGANPPSSGDSSRVSSPMSWGSSNHLSAKDMMLLSPVITKGGQGQTGMLQGGDYGGPGSPIHVAGLRGDYWILQ
jgi:hypothetical protein